MYNRAPEVMFLMKDVFNKECLLFSCNVFSVRFVQLVSFAKPSFRYVVFALVL